jgi:hypothetical protein
VLEGESNIEKGARKVIAKCPECGAFVDATYLAFDYLDKLGCWDGIEDCWECSTPLVFSVTLDQEGRALVKYDRV